MIVTAYLADGRRLSQFDFEGAYRDAFVPTFFDIMTGATGATGGAEGHGGTVSTQVFPKCTTDNFLTTSWDLLGVEEIQNAAYDILEYWVVPGNYDRACSRFGHWMLDCVDNDGAVLFEGRP